MNQRDTAWCLLTEFTQSESLRKHALAVEACMRAYARKTGADEELWGLVGLLHDFDYEKYPTADDHPYKGSEILKDRGYSEEVRRAIMFHAHPPAQRYCPTTHTHNCRGWGVGGASYMLIRVRIIAGQYRSRTLEAPAGLATRPTSDRLRETLFNVLAPQIEGAIFLDLYAGSGV